MEQYPKRIKIINKNYIPFIIVFISLLLMFYQATIIGDDISFSKELIDMNLIEYLKHRYMVWSSRIIIEGALVILAKLGIHLWAFFNSVIMVILIYTISIFLNSEKDQHITWIIIFTILLYPLNYLGKIGWIAATLNYLWPLTMGIFAMLPFYKIINDKKIRWYEIPLYVIALLYAANLEQMVVILVITYFSAFFYLIIKNKKHYWILDLQLLISIASLIFILLTPGNSARKASEITTWFPDYNMLGLLKKVELGFSSTIIEFFFTPNTIYMIFGLLIIIVIFMKYKEFICRLLAIIPFSVYLFLVILKEDISTGLMNYDINRYLDQYGIININNHYDFKSYILIVLLGMLCACIIVDLILALKDNTKELVLCLYCLCMGFITRMVMAFSPTVWSSSTRTYIFMSFAFIICIIVLYKILYEKAKKPVWCSYLIVVSGLLTYLVTFIDI